MKRDFRVFDGEGKTCCPLCSNAVCQHNLPHEHRYIMLASTDGDALINENGIPTRDALEFLCKKREEAWNVWFAFTYDVNMILRDLNRDDLETLWKKGRVRWDEFWIFYVPGKIFRVTSQRGNFTSYDIFSFFQTSFLAAAKAWGVEIPQEVISGKANRGIFADLDIDDIRRYNDLEMDAIRSLARRLYVALDEAGLVPAQWYGPGAVANVWLRKHNAYAHYPKIPTPHVSRAFFGGRSDIAAIGEFDVFKYDIASAYPYALSLCRDLEFVSEWREYDLKFQLPYEWDMCYVSWDFTKEMQRRFYPFPWRAKDGSILYPPKGRGYYWGVEVEAALRAFDFSPCIKILKCWEPIQMGVATLGPLVRAQYKLRQQWKNEKRPGNVALKLALNSLYGKFAQHTAWNGRTPSSQNHAWASWITAKTRAMISEVFATVGEENVVAIATDGVLLRVPLKDCNTNNDLGTWQDEGHHRVLICSPGMYATIAEDGTAKEYKMRGMPRALNYGFVLREQGCGTTLNTNGDDAMSSDTQRFIGMGAYLATHQRRNVFLTETRRMSPVSYVGTSKRIPESLMEPGWREFPLIPRSVPGTFYLSHPYKHIETDRETHGETFDIDG